LAANTNKVPLGTAVIDMFFYTPIMLAKRYATLDAPIVTHLEKNDAISI
jgi:alkanesulfonate monooxygenase SsuD/methylene tetrahydromethanopterin reductase-like flavin-dependent oxidoreductase (luciferase family)